jgi:hypothetical protein
MQLLLQDAARCCQHLLTLLHAVLAVAAAAAEPAWQSDQWCPLLLDGVQLPAGFYSSRRGQADKSQIACKQLH